MSGKVISRPTPGGGFHLSMNRDLPTVGLSCCSANPSGGAAAPPYQVHGPDSRPNFGGSLYPRTVAAPTGLASRASVVECGAQHRFWKGRVWPRGVGVCLVWKTSPRSTKRQRTAALHNLADPLCALASSWPQHASIFKRELQVLGFGDNPAIDLQNVGKGVGVGVVGDSGGDSGFGAAGGEAPVVFEGLVDQDARESSVVSARHEGIRQRVWAGGNWEISGAVRGWPIVPRPAWC
jgi:hypothetical protein